MHVCIAARVFLTIIFGFILVQCDANVHSVAAIIIGCAIFIFFTRVQSLLGWQVMLRHSMCSRECQVINATTTTKTQIPANDVETAYTMILTAFEVNLASAYILSYQSCIKRKKTNGKNYEKRHTFQAKTRNETRTQVKRKRFYVYKIHKNQRMKCKSTK